MAHRIDTPTAQDDLFGAGKDGFRDGNKAEGVAATQLDAAFCNSVQEMPIRVIEAAGLSLVKGNHDQLLIAIQALISGAIKQIGAVKVPVRVATIANLAALSGLLTIDGVDLAAGDRVLVKNQDTGSQNGIYVAAAGAWARAGDVDESVEMIPSMLVAAQEGIVGADTQWMLTTNGPIILGTTALIFTKMLPSAAGVPMYSISSLPSTDIGPIMVIEACEVWKWSSSAYFTGYRSPLCGRAIFGHTAAPLTAEIDAVGGTVSKTAYAALWGYAQENGLVVASGSWVAGTHNFVDVDSTTFRVPDLRNQFLRMTGTDADTANARNLGTGQLDALQNITGQVGGTRPGTTSGAFFSDGNVAAVQDGSGTTAMVKFDASRVSRTSTETRGVNAAYKPRIHI